MILLIDNYDSFSYNLYQLIGFVEPDIKVIRNDSYTVEEIEKMNPEAIFLSPGPGRPKDAGICIHVIEKLGKTIPIFGVCLGHQSICEAFGGEKRLCSLRERICHIHDRSNEKSIGIFYSLSHKI